MAADNSETKWHFIKIYQNFDQINAALIIIRDFQTR